MMKLKVVQNEKLKVLTCVRTHPEELLVQKIWFCQKRLSKWSKTTIKMIKNDYENERKRLFYKIEKKSGKKKKRWMKTKKGGWTSEKRHVIFEKQYKPFLYFPSYVSTISYDQDNSGKKKGVWKRKKPWLTDRGSIMKILVYQHIVKVHRKGGPLGGPACARVL